MKYLNGEIYVEVNDHRYGIHATENIILRRTDPPQSLRTQYQVQYETQIKKNQKGIKNFNNELILKNYPENKQPIQQQPNFKHPSCPSCKLIFQLEFDKRYYCQNGDYIINKQKHQYDNKVRRQDHNYSTRLP